MAVQVGSDTPLVSSRRSTRARKIKPPAVEEEVIVKSESEEDATTSSQPAINCQVSPPEAERNDQSTASGDTRIVSEDVEIKEEEAEEGPIIEEVNPEEEPMIEEVNPLEEMKEETSDNVEEEIDNEETEMQVAQTSQVAVHVVSLPETPGNESPVFAAIDENGDEEEGPVIEEVNPDDYPLSPRGGNVITEEPEDEEAGQAEATALSSQSLRRSTRVRKRPVYYAVQAEAEEETQQDEPETDTSDTEESDSDESETEAESEMETDVDPSETRESYPIAADDNGNCLSRKPFPCGYCGKTFTSKQHVRRHENNLHRQIQRPRPYLCSEPDCGKAFECPSSLEAHTLLHSGLRPFTCGTCGESFRQKGVLKRHQSKHTTERPYACAICKIAFKRKQYLDEHNQRHSGVKPYTCDDCGHSFTSKFLLQRHRKLEAASTSRFKPSKSRPFACTVEGCGRGFKTKYILQKHMRAHSGANKVQCPLCGVDFARKFVLKTHCRKIHGI